MFFDSSSETQNPKKKKKKREEEKNQTTQKNQLEPTAKTEKPTQKPTHKKGLTGRPNKKEKKARSFSTHKKKGRQIKFGFLNLIR